MNDFFLSRRADQSPNHQHSGICAEAAIYMRPSNLYSTDSGLIDQGDIDALKGYMPDVLAFYGFDDLSRNIKSPWRDERTPSAHYYPDDLLHDFGDGTTVDVFGLVEKIEGIHEFPDQVKRVADIVGYTLSVPGAAHPTLVYKPTQPVIEKPAIAGFDAVPIQQLSTFESNLMECDCALRYLYGRGFTDDDIRINHLGYAANPKAASDMFTFIEPIEVKGYIVIPFSTSNTFEAVNYVMLRAIPGETSPQCKELRPAKTKSPLYNEWLVHMRCDVIYVTEGLFDCIALNKLIGKPCLGLGGTGGTRRLISLLYYTDIDLRPEKIILALDADEAGRKASDKLLANLKDMGIPCAAMNMPDGCKDPNDALIAAGDCYGQ